MASALADATTAEIWEAVTDSTTFVSVRDLVNGGWKAIRVGGPGGPRRIQVTVEERRFNQDAIPEENLALDAFSNGQLLCVQGDAQSANHLTDEDLVTILGLQDDDEFARAVEDMSSEILVRRLFGLAERNGSHARYELVRDLVDRRYRVGGTQRTVQAMMDAGERLSGFVVR
jgi:hypothetical protein